MQYTANLSNCAVAVEVLLTVLDALYCGIPVAHFGVPVTSRVPPKLLRSRFNLK